MNGKTAKKLRKKAIKDAGGLIGVSVKKHYKHLKKTLKDERKQV